MDLHPTRRATAALLAVLLASLLHAPAARAEEPGAAPRTAAGRPRMLAKVTPPADWHARRGRWFQRAWGVDILGVRRVSSGYMLRFDYRVLDPAKAAALSDHAARPYLIDEATHTALAVPAMENVGELRQTGSTVPNRTYYVIFGNPGGLVKRGGKVTLVVGNLRAEGLVVD
jgi:hypothetical protein